MLEAETDVAFAQRVRHAHGASEAPCLLDVRTERAKNFAYGRFDLVVADLQGVLGEEAAEPIIASLRDSGVAHAFELR